jgi:hypothetical protein
MDKTLKRWKVFLCYAREDQVMMDDFVRRFRNYNGKDMDVLCDRNATDENMHEVFYRYACECHVALLLVNARFLNPSSYANDYEVPVLRERQDTQEIVLIGVRFSNVSDLETWNEDGSIYFFSLTNNDLPYTRNKDSQNQEFLRKFVAYKQVDEKDLDDYHDRLRRWMLECIRKKFGKVSNLSLPFALRPSEDTTQILNTMDHNSLVYKLEEKLSNDKSYWDEAEIAPPMAADSYAFWYCLNQADYYEELQKRLGCLTPDDPPRQLRSVFEKIERRNAVVRRLLDNDPLEDALLSRHLSLVDRAINRAVEKVAEGPRKNHTEAKSIMIDAVEGLKKVLKDIGGVSLGKS